MSAKRIKDYFRSVREGAFPDESNYKMVHDWLEKSFVWTMENVLMNDGRPASAKDPYWTVVGHSMTQFLSLVEGYNANTDFAVSVSEMFVLNSLGDTDDLIPAMNFSRPGARVNDTKMGNMDLNGFCWQPWCDLEAQTRSHCSSIVKPVPGGDLFVTHNMWTWYWQMLSVWKEYDFSLHSEGIVSSKLAFSSWPGMVSSEDDFYVTGQGFLIAETTNNVYNMTLYELLTPRTLVAWIRARTAIYLSDTGSEWHEVFKKYNSGTYNNQWVVVDTKRYVKGSKDMQSGTVVVGSQLPHYYEYEDVSPFVSIHGYWASYNVPYFKSAWTISGYALMEQLYGDGFSWENSPRAKIFRQRQANLTDMPSIKQFMRNNDWQHDPLALQCPMNQISARADLTPLDSQNKLCLRAPFGAVNAKIAAASQIQNFTAHYIVGPTNQQQPDFQWSSEYLKSYPNFPHYGQPLRYNFDWQTMRHPLP